MCDVSVLIPCFNERKTVPSVVEQAYAALHARYSCEIIVIDDGSTDGLVHEMLATLGAQVIRHTRRRGKGAAIRTGLGAASGRVIAVQDADAEYSPGFLPALVEPILAGAADAVFGVREFRDGTKTWHRVCNQSFSYMVRLKTGLPLRDVACGQKAISAELLRALGLRHDGFEWDVELAGRLASHKADIRLRQLAVSYRPRGHKEGKKLTFADGIAAMWAALFPLQGWGEP